MLDQELYPKIVKLREPGNIQSLDLTRSKLLKEYTRWKTTDSWKNATPASDPFDFWSFHALHDKFPTLSLLALELLKLNVANTNVERSFKTQGLILTPLRNRLHPIKMNQEMLIRFNDTESKRSENRDLRLKSAFSISCDHIKKFGYSAEEEMDLITKLDEMEIVVNLKKANELNLYQQPPLENACKKTKIFAMIAKDPGIMTKRKRNTNYYNGTDDDTDSDDQNFIGKEKIIKNESKNVSKPIPKTNSVKSGQKSSLGSYTPKIIPIKPVESKNNASLTNPAKKSKKDEKEPDEFEIDDHDLSEHPVVFNVNDLTDDPVGLCGHCNMKTNIHIETSSPNGFSCWACGDQEPE